MMSLEDVEKIMDDTADAIEYQRVGHRPTLLTCASSPHAAPHSKLMSCWVRTSPKRMRTPLQMSWIAYLL